MLYSYRNQLETSLPSCGHTCSNLALKVKEKEELKNLLNWGKFSFYVIVDQEIFTYLKNKK